MSRAVAEAQALGWGVGVGIGIRVRVKGEGKVGARAFDERRHLRLAAYELEREERG